MRRPHRPLLALLLALLLVGLGGLAACGSDDGDDEADDSGTTETSEVFDPDAADGDDGDETTTTEDDDSGSSGSGSDDCQPEEGEENEASAIRQVIECLDPDLAEPANSVSTGGEPVTSVYVEGDIAEPDAVPLCELVSDAAYGPVGVDPGATIEIATRSTDGDDEPRIIATRDGEDGDCEAA